MLFLAAILQPWANYMRAQRAIPGILADDMIVLTHLKGCASHALDLLFFTLVFVDDTGGCCSSGEAKRLCLPPIASTAHG